MIGQGMLYTFLQYRFLGKMLGAKYRYAFVWFYLGSLFYGQLNVALSLAMTTRSNLIYNGLCALALNMFLFYGSLLKKCFFTLWMYGIQGLVFSALFPLAHAAAIVNGWGDCPDWIISGIGLVAGLVSFVMMEVLQQRLHMLKRDFRNRDALYLMYIILFIYAAVDTVTELFTGIQGLTGEVAVALAWRCTFIAVGGVGLHSYCVVMLEQRLVKRSAEQQYETMSQDMETLKEHYLKLEHFRHDMRNHGLCLRQLLKEGKAREASIYLGQLEERMEQGGDAVRTGSVFADAIVNPKYDQAKRLGINMDISMCVPKEEEMDPVDLCCLLANALDNALEACERGGEQKDAGWIRMRANWNQDYWVFTISNSVFVPPVMHKGRFLSSKRRQAYGVGLQNIRSVVERCHGVMELEHGQHFTLSVLIPRGAGTLTAEKDPSAAVR